MKTQTEAIKAHLVQHNSITPLEALDKYRCFRLAARIDELRRAGMSIMTCMVSTDDGKRYAKYVQG